MKINVEERADGKELNAETREHEEHDLRISTVKRITSLFERANKYVLGVIAVLILVDCVTLALGEVRPSDRLINSHVIMVLLGAMTVQVGSIMLIIFTYLFRKKAETQAE